MNDDTTEGRVFGLLVGALVLDGPPGGQQILLLQRDTTETFKPGEWGPPAGKVDFGEDLADAVLRELAEEAGIGGTILSIAGYSQFMSVRAGDAVHNVQINFLVQAATAEVTPGPGIRDHRWLPVRDLVQDCGTWLDAYALTTLRQVLP